MQVRETADPIVRISGLRTSIVKRITAKAKVTDRIVATPAQNCTVKLQLRNPSDSRWKTKRSYKLKGTGSAALTLSYPSDWKFTARSTWRLHVDRAGGYDSYNSPNITVKSTAPNSKGLKIKSKSAVIIRAADASVVYRKHKDRELACASTTKMMTALLTLENCDLDDMVSISKKAERTEYTCLYVKPKTKFRAKDLLTAMLVASSNDAAVALAEHQAGSTKAFAKLMNARARKLGCEHTHFANPHGLPNAKHHSSAYDLALIQRACLKHRRYAKTIKKRSCKLKSVGKKKVTRTLTTTDRLLERHVKGFCGGKTGYTRKAGCCFCGVFRYKKQTYIFTTLNNSSSEGRWHDCIKLMKFVKKSFR